jgi:arylformamidase
VHSIFGKALITADDCELPISTGAKRILFRTNTFPNPNAFNDDFSAFSPDAIDAMGVAGIKLIGIDTPSVDPFHSKDLKAHQSLYKHGIANLEGIVLEKAPDGHYELIALPLRLEGFDASPVRAILRPIRD